MSNAALLTILAVSGLAPQDATPRFESAPCPFEASAEALESIDCGHVRVPENWDDPTGRTTKVPVAVLRATSPDSRPDPIVVIEGGPLPNLEAAGRAGASRLGEERDLVFFDYRGMGYGEQVCPGLGEAYLVAATRSVGSAEFIAARGRLARECRAWAEDNGVDLRAYNARSMARDVLAIVDGLGFTDWNIHANSFGTIVAQEIMRLGPPGLRAVVLLGPVALDAESTELNGFSRSLEMMAAYCLREAACAAAYPDPIAAYEALYDRLEREPLRVRRPQTEGAPEDDLRLSGTLLKLVVHQMHYSRMSLAQVPMLVDATARGDLTPIAATIAAVGGRVGQLTGTNWAAQCDASLSWAEAVAAPDVRPALGDPLRGELLGRCTELGVAAAPGEVRSPVESDVPTLILTGEHDPVTPPVYGEAVARGLTRAYVIEVPGHGHSLPGSCTLPVLLDFLQHPERSPDASCIEELPDVPFATMTASSPGK